MCLEPVDEIITFKWNLKFFIILSIIIIPLDKVFIISLYKCQAWQPVRNESLKSSWQSGVHMNTKKKVLSNKKRAKRRRKHRPRRKNRKRSRVERWRSGRRELQRERSNESGNKNTLRSELYPNLKIQNTYNLKWQF